MLGSGPNRIGQGIEFDYCSVHCVWALREAGYQAIIISNNPETVSTDFDTCTVSKKKHSVLPISELHHSDLFINHGIGHDDFLLTLWPKAQLNCFPCA